MKANKTNLKRALKLCAKAHGTRMLDWSSEGQLGVQGDNLPTLADVQTICDAFYGNHMMVDPGYGFVTVWCDCEFLEEVDETTLDFALPYGWMKEMLSR